MLKKIVIYLILGSFMSMFFFPFGFQFLPASINTKNVFALLGAIVAFMHAFENRKIQIDKGILGAIFIVIFFCVIGYISVDINNTSDYSYANYFVSFAVWLFSAYFICTCIRRVHGDVNIRLITCYLALAAVSQCILAMLNNEFVVFRNFVDTYIEQGQGFLHEVQRWYGIGASLDPAGVRFCIILLLISGIIVNDLTVRESKFQLIFLVISFFVIVIIGNIISRTTSVGAILALIYILINNGMLRRIIPLSTVKVNLIFIGITSLAIALAVYLYKSDDTFYTNMRFAFEGFFNWAETGEWSTDSTDKLNNEMWVWPEDLKTWIIGSGLFDNWVYGTDIGYCRLILYNGIVGLTVFSLLFIYSFVIFTNRYPGYFQMFFLLLTLGFIIWVKVSTDIFQIWAVFYTMTLLENAYAFKIKKFEST